MKHTILPTHDNIFVERIQAADKTDGGIIVPENSQERPAEGKIVAIGPNTMTKERRAFEIERYIGRRDDSKVDPREAFEYYEQTFDLGDHVIFGKFAGIDLPVDDRVFVKLKPDEIFCVVIDVPEESDVENPDVHIQAHNEFVAEFVANEEEKNSEKAD